MKIKEIHENERPREKLISNGPGNVSTGELLAILLRTGTKGKNVIETAQELLAAAGGRLTELASMDMARLCSIPGIKRDKAVTVQAAMELGRRFLAEAPAVEKKPIVSPRMVYDEMIPRLKAIGHEELWVILLTSANYRIGRERLSVGDLASTGLDIRKLVRLALDRNAAGLILVHNHPGGNPRPSAADIRKTAELNKAVAAFDIRLVDHIIVSDDCFYSFADEKTYSA